MLCGSPPLPPEGAGPHEHVCPSFNHSFIQCQTHCIVERMWRKSHVTTREKEGSRCRSFPKKKTEVEGKKEVERILQQKKELRERPSQMGTSSGPRWNNLSWRSKNSTCSCTREILTTTAAWRHGPTHQVAALRYCRAGFSLQESRTWFWDTSSFLKRRRE